MESIEEKELSLEELKKRLVQFNEAGKMIFFPILNRSLILGHAEVLADGSAVVWCSLFPEHQGHVHVSKFSRVVDYGKGLTFYDKLEDGEEKPFFVIYSDSNVTPETISQFEEWAEVKAENQEQFRQFLEDCIV